MNKLNPVKLKSKIEILQNKLFKLAIEGDEGKGVRISCGKQGDAISSSSLC